MNNCPSQPRCQGVISIFSVFFLLHPIHSLTLKRVANISIVGAQLDQSRTHSLGTLTLAILELRKVNLVNPLANTVLKNVASTKFAAASVTNRAV